ncbi:helix-turn-helix transcriptional regulator [Bacillus circulans]|uniref:helix-turn-helix domain-containing protein n=1 Tax=Bacillaceae TaxID=186817 RepID=UPI0004B9F15E|nr:MULTISPECIES: helix-turn-helix transcriptional regulator [Bacillaceae]NRG30109.1 helix-turn-helix transcriptional regulator [Niallia circulans]SLL32038.1 RapGH repressor [Mycobacteroides abscessus subsp. abscessus]HWL25383.1 helix-turn-helix transcriptional regulator [Ureibacillus sp.]
MSKDRKIPSEFAKTMEQYRIKKGISLNKLAADCGVSPAYLSRIKTGKRNAPSVPIAMTIARELDIPAEKILKMLGMNEEVKELFDLLSDNEFTVRGQLVEPNVRESIIGILRGVLPYLMKGDTRNE